MRICGRLHIAVIVVINTTVGGEIRTWFLSDALTLMSMTTVVIS